MPFLSLRIDKKTVAEVKEGLQSAWILYLWDFVLKDKIKNSFLHVNIVDK